MNLRSLSTIIFAATLVGVSLFTNFSNANELDQDVANQNRQELKGTVILRIDTRTNEISSVAISELDVKSKEEAIALAKTASYKDHKSDRLRTELDDETGSSSWYWYYGGYPYYSYPYYSYAYYYPTYYYYGYSYNPYYSYNYGYYNYYWYGNCNYRWY